MSNTIAIRPCNEENSNAIRWGKLREERWTVSTISGKSLAKTLCNLMSWENESSDRFIGQFITNGEDKLLVFEMEEALLMKKQEQIVI